MLCPPTLREAVAHYARRNMSSTDAAEVVGSSDDDNAAPHTSIDISPANFGAVGFLPLLGESGS